MKSKKEHFQNVLEKSIPLLQKYMTSHFLGLAHALL